MFNRIKLAFFPFFLFFSFSKGAKNEEIKRFAGYSARPERLCKMLCPLFLAVLSVAKQQITVLGKFHGFGEKAVTQRAVRHVDHADPSPTQAKQGNTTGMDPFQRVHADGTKDKGIFHGMECQRSADLLNEGRKYLFKQRADGTYTNEPIEFFNHGIDALRYAVYSGVILKGAAGQYKITIY